jgi:drug/metabolite transporter (DMT)-like permease
MGFIGVYLYYICFYAALVYSTAQEAFIVNYTWPIWVIIFALVFLKETLSARKIVAILLGFIGVYFVMTKGQFVFLSVSNVKGHIFALIGALCYGLFSVLGKKCKYEQITSMFLYYAFSFIFILITVLLFSNIPMLSGSEFIGLFWIGAIASAIGYVTWFKALKYGHTSKMSNFIFLTPFMSLIFIYFLVGEQILISSFIGLIFMILGILFQSKK